MLVHIHFGAEGLLPWALYLAMWVGFAASVIWRPSVGLFILAFSLPMQTGRYKIHDFFLGSQFVDILLLGAILGLIFKGDGISLKLPLNSYLLILAIFLYFSLWEGSFFVNAPLPLWISDARFSNWKNYVEMFLLASVVACSLKDKRHIWFMIVTMCISALIVNRNYYALMSGRNLTSFSEDIRDSGLLGYAGVNGLAAFEAMFASFLLGIYVSTKHFLIKICLLFVLSSCIYCLLFSFSRGGYAGFLAGMMIIGLLRSRKILVIACIVIVGWQLILPASVQQRIAMTTGEVASGAKFDSSSEERLTLWKDALNLFERNPVTGTGFDTYGSLGRVGPYRDTHNYYVKVLVETGLVGLALFLILLRRIWGLGWSLHVSTDDPFWSALSLGFIALVACAAVVNLFGDRWTYQQVDGYLWILLGCCMRGLVTSRDRPPHDAVLEELRSVSDSDLAVMAYDYER